MHLNTHMYVILAVPQFRDRRGCNLWGQQLQRLLQRLHQPLNGTVQPSDNITIALPSQQKDNFVIRITLLLLYSYDTIPYDIIHYVID